MGERNVDDGRRVADLLAHRPAPRRPDGVFAVHDLTAWGLLQGLVSKGIRVPEDIALIGYDDIEFGAASLIPLSTVRVPHAGFGMTAMDLLIAAMTDTPTAERHVILAPELVVRNSTR